MNTTRQFEVTEAEQLIARYGLPAILDAIADACALRAQGYYESGEAPTLQRGWARAGMYVHRGSDAAERTLKYNGCIQR